MTTTSDNTNEEVAKILGKVRAHLDTLAGLRVYVSRYPSAWKDPANPKITERLGGWLHSNIRAHIRREPGVISPRSAKTYLVLIRKYLRWLLAAGKTPLEQEMLDYQTAVRFLLLNPNTPYVSALKYLWEAYGKTLELSREDSRRIAKARATPTIERSHTRLYVPNIETLVKIWHAFPTHADDSSELYELCGKYFNPAILPDLKTMLGMQIMWGMRFHDVFNTVKIVAKNADGDQYLQVWAIPKGKRDIVRKPPIYRSSLQRAYPFLVPIFRYVYEYAKTHDVDTTHMLDSYPPPTVFSTLPSIIGTTYSEATLYIIMRRMLNALAKQEAVYNKALAPHDVRRAFITTLLNEGLPITAVQRFVGHAKVDTTARYYRWVNEKSKDIYNMLYSTRRSGAT